MKSITIEEVKHLLSMATMFGAILFFAVGAVYMNLFDKPRNNQNKAI